MVKTTMKKKEQVAIVGASEKKERYSYLAHELLLQHGHKTFLIHPNLLEIEGQKVYKNLSSIKEKIDTVTIYVNPSLSSAIGDEIIQLKPKRVIFNPGTENQLLAKKLQDAGIETEEACTLILLTTEQF